MTDICDALRHLVPFVQFKKRERHPWRTVNFSKVAGYSLQNISRKACKIFIDSIMYYNAAIVTLNL